MNERRERLRAALVEIEAFARTIDEAAWAERFLVARGLLDAVDFPKFVDDLLDGTFMAAPALQLLAGALEADVFGGMGSWSDLVPDDGATYRRVSARLYEELKPSLVAAANSVATNA